MNGFAAKLAFAAMLTGESPALAGPKRNRTLLIPEQSQSPMSAGDNGYHRIRSDIIFGVLNPSGRLKLDSMKEDYGLSVSTLREILNRLASEGFVVAEGQRGFETGATSNPRWPSATTKPSDASRLRISRSVETLRP